MASVVIMPRQGQSVESCVITTWNKKIGDNVADGDILFSYETDKSSFDETAKMNGVLLAVFAEEGDDVPCLDPVCVIGEAGEDISGLIVENKPVETVAKDIEEIKPIVTVANVKSNDGKIKISPRAKNLAEKTDADINQAIPTGPNGRIIERDINILLDKGYVKTELTEIIGRAEEITQIPASGYEDVKISNIRKVIAKSMQTSLSTMAQLTLNSSFDAEQILSYRAMLKANADKLGLENITLNDMVLFAAAKTLKNHKALNAHYLDGDGVIRYFNSVNLGIAVDTDRGLIVPTLFNADKLSLNELAKAVKSLIKEAQSGIISPDLIKGGTFTVTNLGSLGVESFTPVINPPQTGILGVDTLMRRIKEIDGKDIFYTAMGLSLTFDHRALDGAPAAKFLKDLCSNLENFNLLMAK